MQVYTKKDVSQLEYELTYKASTHDIAPKVVSYRDNIMKIELYPTTLENYELQGGAITTDIQKKVFTLIDKLHTIDIVHCDMVPCNIVLNPSTGIIRLIDFGFSRHITPTVVDEVNALYAWDYKYLTDLLLNDYKRLQFIWDK